jgi:2'-5' RNA ligase
MARTRTFIAVGLTKPIRDHIVLLQETLAGTGAEVNWVEPQNIHLTLLFLGEVDDREIPAVCRIASDGAKKQAAFSMTVEKAGCFPNPRRPRILWVGVGEGAEPLVALHDDLEIPLQDLGYRREERRYTPHITLGRVKSERSSDQLVKQLARRTAWKAGEMTVEELLIMGSELKPAGPVYTVLGRAKLA